MHVCACESEPVCSFMYIWLIVFCDQMCVNVFVYVKVTSANHQYASLLSLNLFSYVHIYIYIYLYVGAYLCDLPAAVYSCMAATGMPAAAIEGCCLLLFRTKTQINTLTNCKNFWTFTLKFLSFKIASVVLCLVVKPTSQSTIYS